MYPKTAAGNGLWAGAGTLNEMNTALLRLHKKIYLILKLFKRGWELIWQDKLEEEAEKEITQIESDFFQRYYLLERELNLFMLEVQKKLGTAKDKSVRLFVSFSNPFREEIEKKLNELMDSESENEKKKS